MSFLIMSIIYHPDAEKFRLPRPSALHDVVQLHDYY